MAIKFILAMLSLLQYAFAAYAWSQSKSAVHEILAMCSIVGANITLGAIGVMNSIEKLPNWDQQQAAVEAPAPQAFVPSAPRETQPRA